MHDAPSATVRQYICNGVDEGSRITGKVPDDFSEEESVEVDVDIFSSEDEECNRKELKHRKIFLLSKGGKHY